MPSDLWCRIRPVIFVLAAISWPLAAQASDAEQIAAILEHAFPADGPGAAAIAVKDGQVVFRGASGMADLEHRIPLTPASVFRLGSVTKQFTAAALVLLEERGKLSLDDSITQYLPAYPTHGHHITIRHLLTHTSGIFSYTSIPGYMNQGIMRDLTTDELVDVFKAEPMDFAPGEQYRYSNSGYVLAGAIIEKVSGQSYGAFIQENIFEPLGMDHSYYGSHSQIIPNRARGYAQDGQRIENAQYLSMTQPHAAGSLLSTVDDLARWDAALYTDQLLTRDSLAKMIEPGTLNSGEKSNYALGFGVGDFRGTPSISHGGGINGFVTHAMRLPEHKIYVAVLCNVTGLSPGPAHVAQRIAAQLMGKPLPSFTAIELDPAKLKSFAGVYRINEQTRRIVTVEDGRLHTQRTGGPRLEATPHAELGFFYEGMFTHFEFITDADGRVSGMRMFQDGAEQGEEAERTDEPIPTREVAQVDPAIYDGYVGRYEVGPGFDITISRDGDDLFAQATGQPRFQIYPASNIRFFLKVVEAEVEFQVVDGKAQSLVLYQGELEMPGKRIE